MTGLAAAISTIANSLFPAACALCGEETGEARALCGACWREVSFLQPGGCAHCGRPLPGGTAEPGEACEECRLARPCWDRGTAVFRYEGAGRKLVLTLKHADRQDLLPMLGVWAARKGAFLLERADVIAPVPLHWRRRVRRRTNQAADLARHIGRGTAASFAPRLLMRTRSTGSQGGKNCDQRRANVAGAFALGPGPALDGKRVLLVDDVMTTGATLDEAARLLRGHGARVDILVLALVTRDDAAYIGLSENGEADETD